MAVPPVLQKLFSHIDDNKTHYIENLREAVAIKSVSAWKHTREDIVKMIHWMESRLKAVGANTQTAPLGDQPFPDGSIISLPPILFGDLGNDPKKKTVLIYGHLDVQPAQLEDGWNSEPFVLTEKDGKLFGRGSSDDKGPVLAWLHVFEAFKALGEPLPVNIKFVFEGMEESGSEGLDEFLYSKKGTFLHDIDYVCISDNYWLGTTKPCVTYGLRGLCGFQVEVQCASKDLHSGVMGGTVHEAMSDLIYLLNGLVDKNGRILIKGIYDSVDPLTDEERATYKDIEFSLVEYAQSIGAKKLVHEDKSQILMNRWRNPSLSIHGIEGAYSEPSLKTVIPANVKGKFSIRIVPSMEPKDVVEKVTRHLNEMWKQRGSPNEMKVVSMGNGKSWTENPDHPHYVAARKATKHVYNIDPDLTREGGSIPVTLTFQEITGKNVLLLPLGAGDDGAHSQNEKIDVRNYIEGTKLLGAYLYEVGNL